MFNNYPYGFEHEAFNDGFFGGEDFDDEIMSKQMTNYPNAPYPVHNMKYPSDSYQPGPMYNPGYDNRGTDRNKHYHNQDMHHDMRHDGRHDMPYDMRHDGRHDMPYDMKHEGRHDMPYDMRHDGRHDMPYDMKHEGRHDMHRDMRHDGRHDMHRDMRHDGRHDMPYDMKHDGHHDMRHDMRHDGRHDMHHGHDKYPGRGDGRQPSAPPPGFTPQKQQAVRAVDPGAINGCMYKNTYVWLDNKQGFWFYPTYLGKQSVSGYRWTYFGWAYTGFDLNMVESFYCMPY